VTSLLLRLHRSTCPYKYCYLDWMPPVGLTACRISSSPTVRHLFQKAQRWKASWLSPHMRLECVGPHKMDYASIQRHACALIGAGLAVALLVSASALAECCNALVGLRKVPMDLGRAEGTPTDRPMTMDCTTEPVCLASMTAAVLLCVRCPVHIAIHIGRSGIAVVVYRCLLVASTCVLALLILSLFKAGAGVGRGSADCTTVHISQPRRSGASVLVCAYCATRICCHMHAVGCRGVGHLPDPSCWTCTPSRKCSSYVGGLLTHQWSYCQDDDLALSCMAGRLYTQPFPVGNGRQCIQVQYECNHASCME
jgi:hypothetical protein